MNNLPIQVNKGVAGFIPIYPNPKKLITKSVKSTLYDIPLYLIDFTEHLSIQGKTNKTNIAAPIASTPPTLSGIALRIA